MWISNIISFFIINLNFLYDNNAKLAKAIENFRLNDNHIITRGEVENLLEMLDTVLIGQINLYIIILIFKYK